MISPEQCRAARAWLGWPQPELAKRARVGLSTVRDFETGGRKPMVHNREAIQRALEAAGTKFLFANDDKPLGLVFQPRE
jgi:ribosome-binding protein aMBF1 (putative translation factor)